MRARTPTGTYGIGFNVMHNFGGSPLPEVRWLGGAALRVAGLPNSFEQVGEGDSQRPELRSLSFASSSVDTSQGPASVLARARATDDDTGVHVVTGTLAGPREGQERFVVFETEDEVGRNAPWTYTLPLDRYAARGRWRFTEITVIDRVGFQRTYSATDLDRLGDPGFEQVGADDSTPPVLEQFFHLEGGDPTTAPQPFSFHAEASDDLSGVDHLELVALDGSGNAVSSSVMFPGGTPGHAVWDTTFSVAHPGSTPPHGIYDLRLVVVDKTGNRAVHGPAELAVAGRPSRIVFD
jgi:hypothetical protein